MTPLQSPLDYVFPCSLSQFMAARAPPLGDRALCFSQAHGLIASTLHVMDLCQNRLVLQSPGVGLGLDQRRLELQGRVGITRDRCFYARRVIGA